MKSRRIEWIDIARGIGIILVVLGHTVTTVIRTNSEIALRIYDEVYFIHLPLLFFVSGLAFNLSFEKYKEQSTKSYVSLKSKKLLLPYATYSFCVFLIFSIANLFPRIGAILEKNSYGRISFFKWLRGLIIGNNIYSEHLWYIYSLFILSVMGFLLIKIVGDKYRYLLLVITFLMWLFFSGATEYDVIWKTSFRGLWFAIGCLCGFRKAFSVGQRALIIIASGIVFLCRQTSLYNMQPYSVKKYINLIFIFVYVLFLVLVAQILEAFGDKLFKWLGKNSFSIYLLHQPFWGSGLGVVLYGVLHLPIFLCIAISFIACITIPILLDYILKKPHMRVARFMLLGE